ncbi:MAG: GDP-L-fucose synthase [Candidatus Omnitrophica bacterium]|nr:GDP-L-fucose synthase [Candidatus Omnitrophota bacterium]MDD5553082.1 GDP-L-fucose synthase [Candidatus Omnitrophota bacterium]
MFWEENKIMVTGGKGFLGSHLVGKLKDSGCRQVFAPEQDKYDLREKDAITRAFEESRPDIVFHLSAKVGGIGANLRFPAEFFYDNMLMGIQVMEYARVYNVKKFVALGTVCAYPKSTRVPFKEDDLWKGYPEETNAPYGLAKKMLLVQAQAYRKQYGFNAIYLLPANLYGPGDNFTLEGSHVIPAMIKKFFEAVRNKEDEVTLWGTGKATREFLYVEDCADAIILAAEKYNKLEPVNIGSGMEISIRDLARLIADISGFQGKVLWDRSRPDGQPRRRLDISRAQKEFGFRAKTRFREGLQKTVDWYKATFQAE